MRSPFRTDPPATYVDALRMRAQEDPGFRCITFLVDGESQQVHRSYGDLDTRSRAVGETLREAGATGERVLLLFVPGPEFHDGFYGSMYAGAVPVPAYPPDPAKLSRTLPRLQAIVRDCGAKFVLTTSPIRNMAQAFLASAPELAELTWLATDEIDAGAGDAWTPPDLSPGSLAFLQYTSGSTGTPRGAMISHGNLVFNSGAIYHQFHSTPDDRMVSWLPMFHDMGLMLGVLAPVFMALPTCVMSPIDFLRKPYRWLAAMQSHWGTLTGAPNFAYELCVRKTSPEQRALLDLSAWRLAFNGAEPVRPDTLDKFAEAFEPCGFERTAFYPTYGLAEATLLVSGGRRLDDPVVAYFDGAALEGGKVSVVSADVDGARALVGCGTTLPDQEIRIVDPETGAECDADSVGEIWVSGPSIGRGYWQRPEDSEHTFRAELEDDDRTYLRTGDLGFLLDGELFVTGRCKDLVIIRGVNHYPQDIELTVESCHAALRAGCGAAFSVEVGDQERLVVVQELERRYHVRERRLVRQGDRRTADDPAPPSNNDAAVDAETVLWDIREAVATRHEVQPWAVVIIKAGTIFKTSSGKIQRHACKRSFLSDELDVLAEWRENQASPEAALAPAPAPAPVAEPAAPAAEPAAPMLAEGDDWPLETEAGGPAGEALSSDSAEQPATETAAFRKPSVLVVDDEVATLEYVVRALRDKFIVATMDSPEVALQLVKTGTFAAVLSDQRMPGMPGTEFLAKVYESSPHTVRLLVTGFEDPQTLKDAVNKAHVNGILIKPVPPRQLVGAVEEAVDQWRERQRERAASAIDGWIASWLTRALHLPPAQVDVHAPVARYAVDSLGLVELQTELEDWLGRPVPVSLLRGNATIAEIARRLVEAGADPHFDDHHEPVVEEARAPEPESVAVVGLACRVPGADDASQLWALVSGGRTAIGPAPADRFATGNGERRGGFLRDVAAFDAAFFGINDHEAAEFPAEHRLLLETAWEALEDAAMSHDRLAGSDVGVFVTAPGGAAPGLAAARLSHFLDLRGPSVGLDAAGSSSLAAVHLAAHSLRHRECSVAVVAAANIVTDASFEALARRRRLAVDGAVRILDAAAAGVAPGDGCVVVVLRRLADATDNSEAIRAIVAGTAVNHTGRTQRIDAPSASAQVAVVTRAIELARMRTRDVGYVELNATGAAADDGVEVEGLATALALDETAPGCRLGSIKANIGDLEAAAGLAGFVKAVQVVEHGEIPAQPHFERAHSRVALGATFSVPRSLERMAEGSRHFAGVSSFSSSGQNVHVVVENARLDRHPPADTERPRHILCLSARSDEALQALARRYVDRLAGGDAPPLGDVCYTANTGRSQLRHRVAISAGDTATLVDALSAFADGREAAHIARGEAPSRPPRVAFLLTGSAAMQPEIARELYDTQPQFRAILQRCDRSILQALGRTMLPAMYRSPESEGEPWDPLLGDPAAFAVDYALASMLHGWGLIPDALLGEGIGELAAACVAGVMSFDDGLRLAAERAKLLDEHGGDAVAAQEDFVHAARRFEVGAPSIPIVSSVTGGAHGSYGVEHWVRHMQQEPRTNDAVSSLVADGFTAFVEIGPSPGLLETLEALLPHDSSALRVAALQPGVGDWEQVLDTLGALFVNGRSVDWERFDKGARRRRIPLPTYPFERG